MEVEPVLTPSHILKHYVMLASLKTNKYFLDVAKIGCAYCLIPYDVGHGLEP